MDDETLARELASRNTDELKALTKRLFAGQKITTALAEDVDTEMAAFVEQLFHRRPDTEDEDA